MCLFARSRSYLKRSFRRKPWTLRAFRVKSWTDLRINYSAHVSPGCALVCRVRTKSLSLSLSSRDSHISEDTNFISLSHIPFSYSSLLFTSTSYSSVFSRETRSDAIPDVITLPSNPLLPPFQGRNFYRCYTSSNFVAQFRATPLGSHLSQLDDDRVDCAAR